MANIKDIAKKAGVSTATVSRVLNGHPYVSERSRLAVEEAIRQLNYTPNSSAVHLKRGKTGVIAAITKRIDHPFMSGLMQGIGEVALRKGYQIMVCQTRLQAREELRFLHLLQTKQVDGILLEDMQNDWKEVAPYAACGPLVLVNSYEEKANVPMVYVNNYNGARQALLHLVEKGHRAIAVCLAKRNNTLCTVQGPRWRAYQDVLAEAGIEINSRYVFENVGTSNVLSGKELFRAIREMSNKPTALFTGSDQVAAGFILEAQRHGVRIPEDIAVVGFDNQPIAELMDITTVYQPIREMGKHASEILFRLIEGSPVDPSVVEMPHQLVVRSTT
jgi:LacI family repressor for deo operon, udp, cdd, tsx, nupC, and nupG